MSLNDIVIRIDQRLADLDAELTHLTGARAALLDRPAAAAEDQAPRRPQAARPAAVKRAAVKRAAAKPSFEVVPAGKLIAVLTDSEGMTTRELSRATNGKPDQVLALLKEQEVADQVRRSGTRAATRWHAITDEDRIAARVVELEAASRRSRARKN